jgi:hypothetical protein
MRIVWIFSVAVSIACAIGCDSVASLDVTYPADSGAPDVGDDAASADAASTDGSVVDSGVDTGAVADGSSVSPETGPAPAQPCDVDGSTCDSTQGLGCCVPSGAATPFCTDPASAGTTCGGGLFVYCQAGDPSTESACCWNNGTSVGASTSYASECGNTRASACTDSSQCAHGGPCNVVTCKGITIGACGATPVCPP